MELYVLIQEASTKKEIDLDVNRVKSKKKKYTPKLKKFPKVQNVHCTVIVSFQLHKNVYGCIIY
jgi:hypothetical protein